MITVDEIPGFYKVKINGLELTLLAKAIITFSIPYPNSFQASSLFIGFILTTLSAL